MWTTPSSGSGSPSTVLAERSFCGVSRNEFAAPSGAVSEDEGTGREVTDWDVRHPLMRGFRERLEPLCCP